MANILVTGGAGYIGSHTCKHLKKLGHTPITYDNLSRGFKKLVKWGPFIEGDLFHLDHLTETLKSNNIAAVVHFAAYAYVAESVEKPQMYMENNLYGTTMLLEAMKAANVKNILFSSTCAVYGEGRERTLREDHPTQPMSPYGLSKLLTESILKKYGEIHGFNHCALRYFNASGADPEGETGECHDPEPHLIPTLIKKAQEGETIVLFGNDYPTEDGTCVRDFIHVSDLAEAHGLALEALLAKKNKFQLYNLGTGQGISLIEMVSALQSLLDKKLKIDFKERRPGDPSYAVADPERFNSEFQWKPKNSSLEKIFKTALVWHNKS